MAAAVTVLCAVRGGAETEVVVALGAPGSGATVTRRCGDLAELLAAAAAGAGTVAVVSADLAGLDREAVGRLHGAGVRVVALGHDAAHVARLQGLGVDGVVERYDEAALLAAVREAAVMRVGPGGPGGETVDLVLGATGPADAVDYLVADGADDLLADDAGPRHGRVVAVWGPVGAPGRTTTALELAAALGGLSGRRRRHGRRRQDAPASRQDAVLLVDADTYGASVAARLGLLDDTPGLAAVARSAGQGALDLPTLARQSPVVGGRLRVLTGITRAARWPELPASAVEVVLERARELADWTVVDCGALLEADELLMYDTHAPQRNAATLAALQAADVVVVVGAADPVGIQRLVRGLEDLRDVPVPVAGDRVVVANRVRPSAVGAHPENAVREALARYAGVEEVHLVPDDPAGLDGALLAGRTLAEEAPASPVTAAFEALAGRVRATVPAAV
ncbi:MULTISPECIES: AAA family ATPase [unclassified Isoptericola]|uniref:AAA family ATPase n=1 Tax=unclassified Isoptericola TaxID=2623355 RepID=UPI003660655C